MVQYELINEEEWSDLPSKQSRKPDELDAAIDELERGNIIRLKAIDEKDLRGKRLTIGRRATKRGFKVEIRTKDLTIAVRKKEEPATPPSMLAVPTKRGRKRQNTPAELEAAAESGQTTTTPD
jgi:hypothetical protein